MASNIQQTVTDPLVVNWVKAGLALKFTRGGIENYVDSENHKLQQTVMADICRVKALPAGTVCKTCTTHNVLPCNTRGICHQNKGVCKYHDPGDPAKQHKACPTGICDEIYRRIIASHRFHGPSWKNTNALDWCSNPWEWAKCYMAADGYTAVTSAKETDFPGLISVIINNTEFQKTVTENLTSKNNIFCEARNIRNNILHTSTYQVSNAELTNYVDTLIKLLSDPKYLASDTNAQDAITKLNQIKTGFLTVTTQDEAKLRAEALQAISEAKQEAIDNIETKSIKHERQLEEKTDEAIKAIHEDIEGKKQQAIVEIQENAQHIDDRAQDAIKSIQVEGGIQAGHIDEKKLEIEQVIQEKAQHFEVRAQDAIKAIQVEGGKQAGHIDDKKLEIEQVIQEKAQHFEVRAQDAIKAIQVEGGIQAGHIDEKKLEIEQVIQEKAQHIEVRAQEAITAIQVEGGKQAGHIDDKKLEIEQVIQVKAQHIDVRAQDAIKAIQIEGGKQAGHIDEKKLKIEQVIQVKAQHIKVRAQDAIKAIQVEGGIQAGHIDEKKLEIEQVIQVKAQHIDVRAQEAITAIQVEGGKQAGHIDEKKLELEQVIKEKAQHIDVRAHVAIEDIQRERKKQTGAKSKNYIKERKELQTDLISLYEKTFIKVAENDLLQEEANTGINDIYVKPCMKKLNLEQTKLNTTRVDSLQKSSRDEAEEIAIDTYNDIFYNRTKPCRNIYISGDAGLGKSALCQKMISVWCMCHTRYRESSMFQKVISKFLKNRSENEDVMRKFELLCYIPLRNFTSYGNIEEMILKSLPQKDSHADVLSFMLQNESEKCLIILDGLDEWFPPTHYQPSPFITDGLPGRKINNCTIVTTTRPWKLEVLRLKLSEVDQQIKLSGIGKESSDNLVHSMVSILNKKTRQNKSAMDFMLELEKKNLTEVLTIPVILKQLVCLWYDNKPLGESQCITYSGMISLLFELAKQNLADNEDIPKLKQVRSESNIQLPKCFNEKAACQQFRPLLHSLGRLAFKTLFNVDPASSLVFESSVAEMYGLLSIDIDICLKIGILTQSKVTLDCTSRMKSLSFLHKTFQEFLAAMFVSLNSEEFDAIIKQIFSICNSVDHVLEMSKVFVFVSGMNPEAAQRLYKHIRDVTSQDPFSIEYTQSIKTEFFETAKKPLRRLQETILDCVKESSDNGYEYIRPQFEHIFITNTGKNLERLICSNINISSICMECRLPREVGEHFMHADCLKKLSITIRDVDDFGIMSTLVSKCKSTLTTIELSSSYSGYHIPEPFPTILYDVDHLSAIRLSRFKLTHAQIKGLMSYLSQATLMKKISLDYIDCSTRDHHCRYQLDLSRLHQLQHLSLYVLDMNGLNVHNTQIQYCQASFLPRRGDADSVLTCLQAAPKLQHMIIDGVILDEALVVATLPTLVHLQDIAIRHVDFGELDLKLSPEMVNLKRVTLVWVTMTSESCIGFIASIPYTQHPVNVELIYMDKASKKKVRHYIKSCSRFHLVECNKNRWGWNITFYTP